MFQLRINTKFENDVAFVVYECPWNCNRYLVSLSRAREYEKGLTMTEQLNDVAWSDEIAQELQGDFEQAEVGQGWQRIGKTDIALTRFIKWVDKRPIPISEDEWKKTKASQRGFDFKFTVDIAEFDQKAAQEGWNYERRVTFKGRDWWNILVPSLQEAFGEDAMKPENYMKTLSKIRGQYCVWLDVPQSPDKNGNVPTNPNTGKPYTTLKFHKLLASKEEAQAAYDDLGVGNNGTGGSTSIWPADWQGSEEQMKVWAKEQGMSHKELADSLNLANLKTSDGGPVDVELVVSRLLDIPQPMVKL